MAEQDEFMRCIECGQHPQECRCPPIGYARDSMTRPAHTPTPWEHSRSEFDEPCVFDAHERVIAGCDNPQFSPEECKANAALIVRAVNCHDELVKALRLMLGLHDDNVQQGRLRFEKGSPGDRIAKVARAALARAKEQP